MQALKTSFTITGQTSFKLVNKKQIKVTKNLSVMCPCLCILRYFISIVLSSNSLTGQEVLEIEICLYNEIYHYLTIDMIFTNAWYKIKWWKKNIHANDIELIVSFSSLNNYRYHYHSMKNIQMIVSYWKLFKTDTHRCLGIQTMSGNTECILRYLVKALF